MIASALDPMQAANGSNDPNDVLASLIRKLDPNVRAVVDLIAALEESGGQDIDCEMVEMVLRRPCMGDIQVAHELDIARVLHGIIQFACPDIQAAAYSLVPEPSRAFFHLRIGRDLWEHTSLDNAVEDSIECAAILFLIAQNLQLGMSLVTDVVELDVIAIINLRAGKLAMQSSHFSDATTYFDQAISALGDRQWSSASYQISLML